MDGVLARDELLTMFSPLSLEQALHLLDHVTWFPTDTADKWAAIGAYVNENSTPARPLPPETYSGVFARVVASLDGSTGGGADRWTMIPKAKALYELKYSVMMALYDAEWFTFMNMGYAPLASDAPLQQLGGNERVWTYSAALYDRTVRPVDLAGKEVLEVGCGRGGGAAYVTRTFRPRRYVGLDFTRANVAFCRARHREPGLEFRHGDAEALPFDDASFDAVVNVESAHCYPSVDRFLAEVARVLRPGGHLLLSDEWWTEAIPALEESIRRAGFAIVEQECITANIIESLDRLERMYAPLVDAIEDEEKRAAWSRFFGVRVCRNSRHSYESGRFQFMRYVLRSPFVA